MYVIYVQLLVHKKFANLTNITTTCDFSKHKTFASGF